MSIATSRSSTAIWLTVSLRPEDSPPTARAAAKPGDTRLLSYKGGSVRRDSSITRIPYRRESDSVLALPFIENVQAVLRGADGAID